MDQMYSSIRDFFTQQHPSSAAASTNALGDVVLTVCLSKNPEEETLSTSQCTAEEIEELCRGDPYNEAFMYLRFETKWHVTIRFVTSVALKQMLQLALLYALGASLHLKELLL
jgi:hypothetical protein